MVQGFALGTGSAIGRRAVDSAIDAFSGGSKAPEVAEKPKVATAVPTACQLDQSAFMQCLQQNNGHAVACESYFKALQQCQTENS
jgi:hypothetical protein